MEPNPIGIFASGTWKRGGRHHDQYCEGYLILEEAGVWGRMYNVNWGFPLMEFPHGYVLGMGTRNIQGDWDWISGEFMTFDDPVERLQALDRLEGFRPGGPDCLFHRVIFPVRLVETGKWHFAWGYSFNEKRLKDLRKRRITIWVED